MVGSGDEICSIPGAGLLVCPMMLLLVCCSSTRRPSSVGPRQSCGRWTRIAMCCGRKCPAAPHGRRRWSSSRHAGACEQAWRSPLACRAHPGAPAPPRIPWRMPGRLMKCLCVLPSQRRLMGAGSKATTRLWFLLLLCSWSAGAQKQGWKMVL
jgi:hypothetical protein